VEFGVPDAWVDPAVAVVHPWVEVSIDPEEDVERAAYT
jgi:hypothetical protein